MTPDRLAVPALAFLLAAGAAGAASLPSGCTHLELRNPTDLPPGDADLPPGDAGSSGPGASKAAAPSDSKTRSAAVRSRRAPARDARARGAAEARPAERDRSTSSAAALQPHARERALVPVERSWSVDVYGALALATLTERYRNASEEEVEVAWGLAPDALGWGDATFRGDHDAIERPVELERLDGSRILASEWLAVPPATAYEMSARLSLEATWSGGGWRLELPEIIRCSELQAQQRAARDARSGSGRRSSSQGGAPPHGSPPVSTPADTPSPVPVTNVVVTIHDERPLADVGSPSHDLLVFEDPAATVIELAEPAPATSAVIAEWAFESGEEAAASAWVGPESDGTREVLVLVEPPAAPPSSRVRAREVIFVLDTSGSMTAGKRIEEARRALGRCLDELDPADRFNVVDFDSQHELFRAAPVGATASELAAARAWIGTRAADRGTVLLPALQAALEQPDAGGRHRLVVLLTDGGIADESAVLELLDRNLGSARLLVVGIGDEPKTDTLHRIASHGLGDAVVSGASGLVAAMSDLVGSFAEPLTWDLKLDWGGARVTDVHPRRLPDLYGGRPVSVRARVAGELPEAVTLRGATTSGEDGFEAWIPVASAPEQPGLLRPSRARDGR